DGRGDQVGRDAAVGPAEVDPPGDAEHFGGRLCFGKSLVRRAVAAEFTSRQVAEAHCVACRRMPCDGAAEANLDVVGVWAEGEDVNHSTRLQGDEAARLQRIVMGRLRWNVMSRLQLLALVSLLGGLAPLAAGQSLIDSGAMLEDARRLSANAMEGRRVGTPGNAAARRLLVDRFRAVGLEPFGGAFEHPFAVAPDLTGVNIAGELPGRQTGLPWLVVSAHYDHLGIRAGRIFNGANDNASGAAALPAMADYFRRHPIRHPLLVVAFDAEERGMLGAYAFVEALRARGEAVAFNVNVDMVARDRSRTLWVAGVSRQPWLRP